jgi:hypothetical protein
LSCTESLERKKTDAHPRAPAEGYADTAHEMCSTNNRPMVFAPLNPNSSYQCVAAHRCMRRTTSACESSVD